MYLDQNKWIQLAREENGKNSKTSVKAALEFVLTASRAGTVAFPLSAIHYMETARIHDLQRRSRLGSFMWELSKGYTIASTRHVLCHELEIALSHYFPFVTPGPFSILSKGWAHAFGWEYREYRIPEPFRSSLPQNVVVPFEEAARTMLEKAAITGEGPGGTIMPPFTIRTYNERFKDHLDRLHPTLTQMPGSQWEDALHAMVLADILEPFNQVLEKHNIDAHKIDELGKEHLSALVDRLPSRTVDLHLYRQVLKNPQLKSRITDLEDWSGLGLASAYCDVVVCEKHFADLLLRDGFRPPAQIITDILELPDVV